MGGKLWKLGRMPRARYLEVEAEVRALLGKLLGDDFRIPRYSGDKPDFGDMDVVVCLDRWDPKKLISELGIAQHKSVGPLLSTVFRDLQVDFFPRRREVFLSTYDFLSFNDVGNLLGKMFHRLGIKYGEDGLFWVHRGAQERFKVEILLTRDARRGYRLLGLDPTPWERGFETLEAMFRWVLSSPYFSVAPYVDRSGSTERTLKERRTMRAFVELLEREKIGRTFEYQPAKTYIPWVAAQFPEVGLEREIGLAVSREAREQEVHARFNGNLVMEARPGLFGNELGLFMKRFREHRPDFEEWLLAQKPEDVRELIARFV